MKQAAFCRRGLHVAEKPVSDDYVLRFHVPNKPGIAGIRAEPDDSFFEPWPDSCVITLQLKHRMKFLVGHALKNRRVLVSRGVPHHISAVCPLAVRQLWAIKALARINSFFGKVENFL